MKKCLVILISLVLIFSFTACGTKDASADTTQTTEAATPAPTETAASSNKILFATGEWAPFTSESMDGKGFFTEIVTAVLNEMGAEYEYAFYPWERCEKAVESGNVWAAFPYAYTAERAEKYLYSEKMAFAYTKFFYYKKNPNSGKFKYDTLEDLKNFKVGGINGYFYKDAFDKAKLNVDWVSNEDEALKMLIKGRIDLAPFSELAGWDMIKKNFPDEVDNFAILDKPINADNADLSLIVSKAYPNSQELLDKFNKAFQTIKDNGTYDSIMKKYNLK